MNHSSPDDLENLGIMPPSVLSGRSDQYSVRRTQFYWEMACGGCGVKLSDPNNLICWYGDISATTTWHAFPPFQPDSNIAAMPDHTDRPHSAQPVGQLSWNGRTAGNYDGSDNSINPTPTFSADFGVGNINNPMIYYAPETASTVLFDMEGQCNSPAVPVLQLPAESSVFTDKLAVIVTMAPSYITNPNFTQLSDIPSNGQGSTVGGLLPSGTLRITNTADASHPGYGKVGTQQMQQDLESLINTYTSCPAILAQYLLNTNAHFDLVATATGLRDGGLLDIDRDWQPAHNNHRAGENIDISLAGLNANELKCLYNAINSAGLIMNVPGEAISCPSDATGGLIPGSLSPCTSPNDTGPHVHLWTGETHFYPAPAPYVAEEHTRSW